MDTITIAKYTATEFSVILPDGRVKTKAARLADMRTAKPAPVEPFVDQQVQMYGDVAVRRSLWGEGTLRVTDIWVKKAAGWQVVAVQITEIKR